MEMNQLVFTLPLPAEGLHPNKRPRNHAFHSRLVRDARETARCIANGHTPIAFKPFERCTMHATFHMPRRRDDDGLLSWLKHYRDGIADAGLVSNDAHITMLAPSQVTGKKEDRRVVITLTRGEKDAGQKSR
jgi:hypothetical protein